ncbi:MAG: cold shock domain-containing protein [Bernardetiaceae bacterium]|nr:cold shock domain-containing protein [Bernardetiaceae bacterium]
MKTGKVKFFNQEKGYGFIVTDGTNAEVFVHISEVRGGQPLNQNDSVSFEEKMGKKGLNAVNVSKI